MPRLRWELRLGHTELEELTVRVGEADRQHNSHLCISTVVDLDSLLEEDPLVLGVLLGVLAEAPVLDQSHVGAGTSALSSPTNSGRIFRIFFENSKIKLTAASSTIWSSCPRTAQVRSTCAISSPHLAGGRNKR